MPDVDEKRPPQRWDPSQYARFAEERARPFHDLIARVPLREARLVVDLGCGSGELTRRLLERCPDARVIGLDHSPEMLTAARRLPRHTRLSFVHGDIADWRSAASPDVVIANASLHWVHDHARLIEQLVAMLAPKGILAVQMPYNHEEPCHVLYELLRGAARWRALLGDPLPQYGTEAASWYFEQLTARSCDVDLWETIYHHRLSGPQAVVEWVKSTLLSPTLQKLEGDRRREFLDEYRALIGDAYPETGFATLLRYRRLFFVAQRQF
jgi:trans-aconitate 2-methyltransferase